MFAQESPSIYVGGAEFQPYKIKPCLPMNLMRRVDYIRIYYIEIFMEIFTKITLLNINRSFKYFTNVNYNILTEYYLLFIILIKKIQCIIFVINNIVINCLFM